jgi:hypothetical protein
VRLAFRGLGSHRLAAHIRVSATGPEDTTLPLPAIRITPMSVHVAGRTIQLPQSRGKRMMVGGGFVVGGLLGFLPVLGFWMLPVGLVILSNDVGYLRRRRRRVVLWWYRRKRPATLVPAKRAAATA